jgi:hypothetical protein
MAKKKVHDDGLHRLFDRPSVVTAEETFFVPTKPRRVRIIDTPSFAILVCFMMKFVLV